MPGARRDGCIRPVLHGDTLGRGTGSGELRCRVQPRLLPCAPGNGLRTARSPALPVGNTGESKTRQTFKDAVGFQLRPRLRRPRVGPAQRSPHRWRCCRCCRAVKSIPVAKRPAGSSGSRRGRLGSCSVSREPFRNSPAASFMALSSFYFFSLNKTRARLPAARCPGAGSSRRAPG